MSTGRPWSIERIREALGSPDLARRFTDEIGSAPAHRVLAVFAKWQGIAERTLAAVERGRQAAAAEAAGREVPGEWIDITRKVQEEAALNRSRGAACG
ncbi:MULTISPECIES: hypothetical protein [Streptomyces]|uniref:Uncharacterized protein n=1 Tax=Streptomyces morookaense TaxID=1970 RepID=A0A7Y7B1P3_STRMO|nr:MULTISPECIES: hypothetical protein [Streptomyces]MCC2278078.1 hypothetical protein [Streptomyces sp. ET3-23]NVK77374.1 hypothetical protein [Streptomyces morookaense]GHF21361.1 hypothetical protein GCM10010359_23510 [Streptomyces morookaense]